MLGPSTNNIECECSCRAIPLCEASIWEFEEEISWAGTERGYVECNKGYNSCNMREGSAKDEKLE